MNHASRFERTDEVGPRIVFTFEGKEVTGNAGESLAAALLALSGAATQKRDGDMRTPYCMMGVCFDCRVEVDGRPNVQACLTPLRAGMVVRRQRGETWVEGLENGL